MDKLRKKQLEAIQVVEERIKQWNDFESDYGILLERLNTLPQKLSVNIMVPIGKVAYIPGQLYRTNEVLAFLGDNWFVERTAYQVCCIVEHRLQDIRKQLERERKNLDDINSQYSITNKMHNLDQDIFEIKEEYDPVKEEEWNKRRWGQKDVTGDREKNDDRELVCQLFERLNQLEKEEEEQEKLLKQSKEAETRKSLRRKIVETSTELMKKNTESNEMNDRGKVELMGDRNPLQTIHFKHSEQSGLPPKSSSHELHSNDSVTQYLNPGDIYMYTKAIADSIPVKLADDDIEEAQHKFKKSVHFKSHHTAPHAFSGVVMERNSVAIADEGAATKVKESKRETVSKFKLSRMT